MPPRRRNLGYGIGFAIVLLTGLVAGLLFLRNPQRAAETSTGDCVRPQSAVGLSDPELELAAVTLTDVSVGRFHAVDHQKVVRLLTDAASDNLVADYLVCIAIRRGDVEPHNPEQIDYLRRFWSFMQSKPSPEQVDAWQQHNTMPRSKASRTGGVLETIGIETTARGDVLRITQTSGQDFGIINAGSQPFLFWFNGFPKAEVGLSPDGITAMSIDPGKTITFHAYVLWASQLVRQSAQFSLETNLTEGTEHIRRSVTIEVDRQRFESELKKLAVAVAQDLNGKRPDRAGQTMALQGLLAALAGISAAEAASSDASPRGLTPESILTRAPPLVARTLGLHSDGDVRIATGAFFDAVNWPELATRVFSGMPENQRASIPVGFLKRSAYLAAQPSDDGADADALTTAFGGVEASRGALKTYKAAMFQTPFTLMDRALANSLVTTLLASPETAFLGDSLKGDLRAAEGDYDAALASYNAALVIRQTNSLTIRRNKIVEMRKGAVEPEAQPKETESASAGPAKPEAPSDEIQILVSTFDARLPQDIERMPGMNEDSASIVVVDAKSAWAQFCEDNGYDAPDVLVSDWPPDTGQLSSCEEHIGEIRSLNYRYPYLGVETTTASRSVASADLQAKVRAVIKGPNPILHSRFPAMDDEAYSPIVARLDLAFDLCNTPSLSDRKRCVTAVGDLNYFPLTALYYLPGLRLVALASVSDASEASKLTVVDGVRLSPQTVRDGTYPWTRTVYMWVKVQQTAYRPALSQLLERMNRGNRR